MALVGTDLLNKAKLAARDSFNDLERPEQDIVPVLLTTGKRGLALLAVEMPDGEAKEKVAKVIMATIAISQATECAFICTAWVSPPSVDDTMPSRHPERQEKVVLVHWHPDGVKMYAALVIRHKDRAPDLGLWEEMGGVMGGRFGEAIERGMKMAASVHEVPGLAARLDDGWDSGDPSGLLEEFLQVLERNGL